MGKIAAPSNAVLVPVLAALWICACPAFAGERGAVLRAGEILKTGEYLVARDRAHFAILQGDGNFCVYKGGAPEANKGFAWCAGGAQGRGDYFAILQRDGSFCAYRGTGPGDNRGLAWCSNTAGAPSARYFLSVDGPGVAIWLAPWQAEAIAMPGPGFVAPRLIWSSRPPARGFGG